MLKSYNTDWLQIKQILKQENNMIQLKYLNYLCQYKCNHNSINTHLNGISIREIEICHYSNNWSFKL